MPTTPRGFRYPAGADVPNVPLDMQELAEDIDGQYIQGTLAARPAAAKLGRQYRATDTGALFVDLGTGNGWMEVGKTADDVLAARIAVLETMPVATVRRNSNQSIVDYAGISSWTAITFTSALTDPDGVWVAGTPTRLIVPETGHYVFTGEVQWAGSATGVRAVGIRKGGSQFIGELSDDGQTAIGSGAAGNAQSVTSAPWEFTAGQYAELVVAQSSGGALNILGGDAAGHEARLGFYRVR